MMLLLVQKNVHAMAGKVAPAPVPRDKIVQN